MSHSKRKFFLTFAYPTTSGALHVGHARSYTLPDIIAKYKIMQGNDVYFPIGFHATGGDAAKIFKTIKANPEEALVYGIDPKVAGTVNSPEELVGEFRKIYIKIFKMAGFSLNYDTQVSTIDGQYNKFVQWQFRKLKEKGYLVQRDYRVAWCPKEEQPVNLDAAEADIKEWKGARIKDYVTIKFGDSTKFMASTLRPETVFGATNIWVNPDADYVEVLVDGEKQIVSKSTVIKLRHLQKSVQVVKEYKGSDFAGKSILNPLTNKQIPIYMAEFVMPDDGTGIVMSVPGHDPFDYFYFRKISSAPVPKIIEVEGKDGTLVETMLRKYGQSMAMTKEKMDGIKEKVYLEELNKGRMSSDIPEIGGFRVEEAKKTIIKLMDAKGVADRLYDLSIKPIFCRCGTEVVIRSVKGQWFIDYDNPEWKKTAKECIANMTTLPGEYKKELGPIIDWLGVRACVRRSGLGTRFPFDESWIIEALSDSTIYMAFYPISENINNGVISKEHLDDSFFDYVYLGVGDAKQVANRLGIEEQTLNRIRQDFDTKYPLDLNVGGIEHKSVHFPFSIFTHTAIFRKEHWPVGIFLNWHVVSEGQKMSKHLGNTVYWEQALNQLGSDPVRLYVSSGANQWSDFDWKAAEAERYRKHVADFRFRVQRFASSSGSQKKEVVDAWLESKLNSNIEQITRCMESFEIRKAIQILFFEMNSDISWYENRGGSNRELLGEFILKQLQMLYPFIPDTSVAAMKLFKKDPIVMGWPKSDKDKINKKTEDIEKSISATMDDIRNIIKLVKNGKELYLYVATEMEERAYSESIEMARLASEIDKVHICRAGNSGIYDPENRAKRAKFLRPAIYIVVEGGQSR
jgi:leucyl-tRNA synthetase